MVGDNFYKPVSNLVYLPRASKVHANLSYLVTSKTKITRASFLACQTAPLHRKNIHGKDVSNKSISEKPRHSPTTKQRWKKNAKGHKVGRNLALLAGNVHRFQMYFPCLKRRITIAMVRVLEYSIFKFNYQLLPSDPDGSPK